MESANHGVHLLRAERDFAKSTSNVIAHARLDSVLPYRDVTL
jgi:hypothetical protein